MTEQNSRITRRKFIIAGSAAAIASPLLMKASGSMAAAKPVEQKAPGQQAAKSGNVYFITKGCVGCQTCRTFCPVKAIHFGDTGDEIDQKKCIHCGTCYRECPVSAITETAY